MILGFSDAKLSVLKTGPVEVREQGLLAHHIGEKTCPRIMRVLDNGYEMELLESPGGRGPAQLEEIYHRLHNEVWNRRPYESLTTGLTSQGGWLDPLLRWSEKAPWLTGAIRMIYPHEPADGYCLIHGDPSLSNLMARGSYLVLTDPMPRMKYREEIPNRVEVDIGKLIQSAVGWERVLGCSVIESMWNEWEKVMVLTSSLQLQRRSMIWGAIHLARVHLRANDRRRTKISAWAAEESRRLAMLAVKMF